MPDEVLALMYIDRFGAENVYGRALGLSEMRRLTVVENVIKAYQSRKEYRDADGYENWAEWAAKHEHAARLLEDAMIEARRQDGGESTNPR